MREINVIFEVEKSNQGGRNVVGRHFTYENRGRTIVPVMFYGWRRTIAEAEALARKATLQIYDAAEWDDLRFNAAKAYLARRAARPPHVDPQLALF